MWMKLRLFFLLVAAVSSLYAKSVDFREENRRQGRFLQIAEKTCQGPEGQPGICMFNYQCQRQKGVVVATCLDGFIFGACCHQPPDSAEETNNNNQTAVEIQPEALSAFLYSLVDKNASQSVASAGSEQLRQNTTDSPVDNDLTVNVALLADRQAAAASTPPPLATEKPSGITTFIPGHSDGADQSGPVRVTVTSNRPVIDQSDVLLQETLQALLSAHTTGATPSSVVAPTTTATALPNPNLHYHAPVKDPNKKTGKPTRRPPKRKTTTATTTTTAATTTTATTTTTAATTTTTSATTTTPTTVTTTTSTTTVATTSTTKVAPPRRPVVQTEDYFGVLQYLVSNPPNWILDEIRNQSHGPTLTTWYPLPIPEMMVTPTPSSQLHRDTSSTGNPATSSVAQEGSATLSTTKKPKRNKTRRPGAKRTTTTPPSLAKTESTTTSSTTPTTTTPTTTTPTTTTPTTTTPTTTTPTTTTPTTTPPTTTTPTTTTPTTTTPTTTKRPRPVYDYKRECGVRPMYPEARIVGGKRSDFGHWPWQVLVRESTWFGIFSKNKCGGVLISDRHVLTAAHCQPGFLGSLVVVLGEFDLGQSEPVSPLEKNVRRVIVHRDYVERTFENDLAILELDSAIPIRPSIVPICLPFTNEGDFSDKKAFVTGWGKLSHNGPTPGVLHEVDVPIMSNVECHDMFKKAGHEKKIHDSFVCAGYPEGKKDSCEGDSGGPLMVERDDGRWVLIGTVSHGIRCAYPNMPGVYMRMTHYRPWIERVTGIGGASFGR